jgi:hypothetical protein
MKKITLRGHITGIENLNGQYAFEGELFKVQYAFENPNDSMNPIQMSQFPMDQEEVDECIEQHELGKEFYEISGEIYLALGKVVESCAAHFRGVSPGSKKKLVVQSWQKDPEKDLSNLF